MNEKNLPNELDFSLQHVVQLISVGRIPFLEKLSREKTHIMATTPVSVIMDHTVALRPKIDSAIARAQDLSSYRFVGDVELTVANKDGVITPKVTLAHDDANPDPLTQTSRTMFEIIFAKTLATV